MTSLPSLIKRLEECTGPDRELDAEIAVALRILPEPSRQAPDVSWIDRNFPEWRARKDGKVEVVHSNGTGGVHWQPARYTASVDAAMQLVPEGWTYHIMGQKCPPGTQELFMADAWMTKHHVTTAKYDVRDVEGATPAIALTISCLRARQAQENNKP